MLEGIQAGIGSISIAAAAFGSIAVVFPRPYTAAPIVVVDARSSDRPRIYAVVGAVTTRRVSRCHAVTAR